jgi:hypothetical protein
VIELSPLEGEVRADQEISMLLPVIVPAEGVGPAVGVEMKFYPLELSSETVDQPLAF